jgi:hypothetical protein
MSPGLQRLQGNPNQRANERLSLDFVADQFIDGRRMRILVVVDDRSGLPLQPSTSM